MVFEGYVRHGRSVPSSIPMSDEVSSALRLVFKLLGDAVESERNTGSNMEDEGEYVTLGECVSFVNKEYLQNFVWEIEKQTGLGGRILRRGS